MKQPNPLQVHSAQADERPVKKTLRGYTITDQFGNGYQIQKKFVKSIKASSGPVPAGQIKVWDIELTEENPYNAPVVRSASEPSPYTRTVYSWVSETGREIEIPEGYILGIERKKRQQSKSFKDDPFDGGSFEFRN